MTRSELVEVFRAALMKAHSDDWDMDTVSEAAHICADQLAEAPGYIVTGPSGPIDTAGVFLALKVVSDEGGAKSAE